MTDAPSPAQLGNHPQGSVTIAGHEYPLREWVDREWKRYLHLLERFDKVRLQREFAKLYQHPPQKSPKAVAAEQRLHKDRKRFDAALKRMQDAPESWEDEDDEKFDKLTERLEASIERAELLELEFAELVRPHADRMTELNDQLEGTTDECYARMCYYLAWYPGEGVLDSEEYLKAEQAWVDSLEGDDYNRAEQVCRVGQKSFLARTLQRLQVQGKATPGMSGASTSGRSRTGSRRRAMQS